MKTSARASKTLVCLLIFLTTHSQFVLSQTGTGPDTYSERPSRLRGVIEKYDADAGILNRFYSAPLSTNRVDRFTELNMEWLKILKSFDFASLNHDEQIDYVLFRNFLEHEQKELARNAAQIEEMSQLVPFAKTISNLEDERRKLVYPSAQTSAALLNDLKKVVVGTQRLVESGAIAKPKRTVANRAAKAIGSLRTTLQRWYGFHSGYDPEFTWWNAEPYKALDTSLQSYQTFVSEKLVGIRPDDNVTIIGDPIGREALMEELAYEMIPYTPEELIELANKEFAWCEAEMKKASREMGFGDDWKKALESVKQKYVEPGKQPQLIKDLAYQAIEFVEKNSLVTVPPGRSRWLAHGDDVPGASASEPFLSRWRDHFGFVSHQYDDA